MSHADDPIDRIRPRVGLRNLRRGELDSSHQSVTPTVLTRSALQVMLRAEIDRAGSTARSLLVARGAIRPMPGRGPDLRSRELPEDLVARLVAAHDTTRVAALSGTELLLAVPVVGDRPEAERISAALLDALTEPVVIDGLLHHFGPRLGVALLDGDNPTVDKLLEGTRLALDETSTEQPMVFFHPFQRVRHDLRQGLADDLRAAVVGDHIGATLQPVVELASREVVGYEVLARWDRPGHGPVPFAEIAELASSLGVDHALQANLLRRTVALFGEIAEPPSPEGGDRSCDRRPVTVWLPTRPDQLLHPELAGMIIGAVTARPHVDFGLVLKPTPPAGGPALTVLREMADAGVRAAIGDFGIGNANLTTVRSHGFDSVTLDPTLTRGVATSQTAAAVVGALITIADRLDLVTTGQGIDGADQLEALVALGCSLGQGPFVDRAITSPQSPAHT